MILEKNEGDKKSLTYYRYCGTTILCDYIGQQSGPIEEHYLIYCPECGCFHCTRGNYTATNNSGRLNLDPPDLVCNHCGLHLRIIDGEAEVVFHGNT